MLKYGIIPPMNKAYLYHLVPKNMSGKILYPLNVLKNLHPDLYDMHSQKYTGREQIMDRIIPTLNCKWNDVIHFTAVPPRQLKSALAEAGIELPEMSFYEIDPNLLDPKKTTVFLYKEANSDTKMDIKNFADYDPRDIEKYSIIPDGAKAYYKEMSDSGRKPLFFHLVPHILYRGELDVEGLPIIKI